MRVYLHVLLLTAVSTFALTPTSVDAQYRYPPRYPFGVGYVRYDSTLRLAVKPNHASVFVDGYFAGQVDDFDGVFQRLNVEPGQHEIVVYLQGHRSLRERLYLSPNSSRKITGTLEPLGPGEADEGAPTPSAAPPMDTSATGYPVVPSRRGPPLPATPGAPASPVATLSIRVQPGDAEVTIDGERWTVGSSSERLLIQLTEGRHVVEVRKAGYRPFSTEIQLRAGQTTPVNVSLTPDR